MNTDKPLRAGSVDRGVCLPAASYAELADFVENAVEGLHRVGPDGTILWANRAELQLLGYAWDEYVGRHIAEFHDDPATIDYMLATLLSGGTLYDQPARLRCKDGAIKHVLIHSNGHFENGQLRYTRCFTRDATARHERDVALAQRNAMLLNAPRRRGLADGPRAALSAGQPALSRAGRLRRAGRPHLRGGLSAPGRQRRSRAHRARVRYR